MSNSIIVRDETGALGVVIETSADETRLKVRRADGHEAWIDASLVEGDRLKVPLDRLHLDETSVISLVEERLVVGRRVEETGVVRLHKSVTEREETVRLQTVNETFSVERVPMDAVLQEPVGVRQEGDTTIYPIMEEVLVVEKRLMLREEIRVTRVRTEVPQERTVVLRKEEAVVEREGSET